MSWRPPPGVVALAVVMLGVGGIVNWVHEGQKRERQVCALAFMRPLARRCSQRCRRPCVCRASRRQCDKPCTATSRSSVDDTCAPPRRHTLSLCTVWANMRFAMILVSGCPLRDAAPHGASRLEGSRRRGVCIAKITVLNKLYTNETPSLP